MLCISDTIEKIGYNFKTIKKDFDSVKTQCQLI